MARWALGVAISALLLLAGLGLAACGGDGGSKGSGGHRQFTLPTDAITLTGPVATVNP